MLQSSFKMGIKYSFEISYIMRVIHESIICSVCMETMLWTGGLISDSKKKKRDVYLPHSFKASSEAYQMDIGVSFPKGNAAET